MAPSSLLMARLFDPSFLATVRSREHSAVSIQQSVRSAIAQPLSTGWLLTA